MSCNEKVRVSLLSYYNAFMVIDMERTYYWYEDDDVRICTEDIDEVENQLGNVLHHNAKVIAMSAFKHTHYYFCNTKWYNIIARSDGWFRDFGSEEVSMYPPGYDFNLKIEDTGEYDFITSILLAPSEGIETC
jgi:hypothetical protein